LQVRNAQTSTHKLDRVRSKYYFAFPNPEFGLKD